MRVGISYAWLVAPLLIFSSLASVATETTVELKFRDPRWSGFVSFDDEIAVPFRLNTHLTVYQMTSLKLAYSGVAEWDETEWVSEPETTGVVVDKNGVASIFGSANDTVTGISVGTLISYGRDRETIWRSNLQFFSNEHHSVGWYWTSLPSAKGIFGGIYFPAGPRSFADRVVMYEPEAGGGGGPAIAERDRRQILGSPENGYVSLGNGGQVVVRFTDNLLTGSGDTTEDLHIFTGADDPGFRIHLELRRRNGAWIPIGVIGSGPVTSFDVDSFGVRQQDRIAEVRLTDDGSTPGNNSAHGSRVFAVGASSTVADTRNDYRLTYWVQAHIGGISELLIDGDELVWHHLEGSAPGLANALSIDARNSNSPTIVDSNQGPTIEWIPSGWPSPLSDGTHPESMVSFPGLTPVFPEREWCWYLEKNQGVGAVKIVEQPSSDNGFALRIRFDDLGSGRNQYMSGGGHYSVKISTTGRGC